MPERGGGGLIVFVSGRWFRHKTRSDDFEYVYGMMAEQRLDGFQFAFPRRFNREGMLVCLFTFSTELTSANSTCLGT